MTRFSASLHEFTFRGGGVRFNAVSPPSHPRRLPPSAAKDEKAHDRQGRERDRDRVEHSAHAERGVSREHIGDRDFPEPETEEIDQGWREGIARAVEGLGDYHAP